MIWVGRLRRHVLISVYRRSSAVVETNPIWPGLTEGGSHGGQECKTNPICRPGRRNVQNEPNFRRSTRPSIPIFRYSSTLTRHRLCKTNPIPGRAGRDTGQSCETKPNLGGLGHVGKRVIVSGAASLEGGTCEMNPIPGWAGWDEAPRARGVGQSCETKPICTGSVKCQV